ncbi:MAG: T9SS type A sorting domain-containing protein [Candidatus Marinimicrobia bacterium]|nr:T9SS type A sorting domain-containing protein [Candidatus Neomarinimicrobiota bacterium]
MISNSIGVMGSPEFSGHQKGILGLGPLGNVEVGDTMEVFVAMVGGKGEYDLINRIQKARSVYSTQFRLPSPPNPPQFELIPTSHQITIDWSWKDEYYEKGMPPEESIDNARGDSLLKDFEGYRIYRSTVGENGPWQLIAEYDSLNNYGYDIGLQYRYTDTGLINGMTYYYAVTAFDLPDQTAGQESMESPKFVSLKSIVPGPILEDNETDDQPYAVPNPYCSDNDYTTDPVWEPSTTFGRTTWYEIDRNITFMNIPDICNIKIFTIDGYLVKSIDHNKTTSGSNVAKWNLLNINNHTVGSGIYYFVVKDIENNKTYINKFVVVK